MVNAKDTWLQVEVAYALPTQQVIIPVRLKQASTIEDAIIASGILEQFTEIDLKVNKIGIFSKVKKLNTPLRDQDRIEIYRKLIADPKAVRKKRAAEGKAMRKGSAN